MEELNTQIAECEETIENLKTSIKLLRIKRATLKSRISYLNHKNQPDYVKLTVEERLERMMQARMNRPAIHVEPAQIVIQPADQNAAAF